MGTGNMLLGYARRSVGDVVMYRTGGEQRFRARNRNPKNPKTQAQQLQRAIVATVTKAYSQFKEICDHSYEGKAAGAETQAEFLRVNMNLLRSDLVNDVTSNRTAEESIASVVKPNATYPTMYAYQVSRGTLFQNLFTVIQVGEDAMLQLANVPAEGETINAYLSRLGIQSGDIFTILAQSVVLSNGDFASQYGQYASAPSTSFGFVRLIVKSDIADTVTAAAATFGQVFEIENRNCNAAIDGAKVLSATNNVMPITLQGNETIVTGYAIIRSRRDSGLRSTERMQFQHNGDSGLSLVSPTGIKHQYIMNAWGENVDTLGASELILEGGGF